MMNELEKKEIAELIRQASENTKGRGIEKYDTYDDLPVEAEDGDLAYVKNAGGIVITEPFKFGKKYAVFVPKREIPGDALITLPAAEDDDMPFSRFMAADFRTASAEKEGMCFWQKANKKREYVSQKRLRHRTGAAALQTG